ncbi:hypothetical protein [Streptomyces sp. NPDC057718]|uniref:hypothetical protein n=1 Tax=Streptomyces sp. NPDC057718 TaxID=3346225 RepID=UPI003693D097
MGWQTDQFGSDHEGYAVAVMGDGTEPAPINGNSAWWLYNGEDGKPRALAVRAGCACGWRSSEMFPVDFDDEEGTTGYEFDSGPYAAWDRLHIAPLLGAAVPPELSEAIEIVRKMLAGLTISRPLSAVAAATELENLAGGALQRAVTAARDNGSSWDEVGRSLGRSRQAAHQRFAKALFRG